MYQSLSVACSHTLHYTSAALHYLKIQWLRTVYPMIISFWMQYWNPVPVEVSPIARYFLGLPSEDMEKYLTVPEKMVYVEEWVAGSTKKLVVRYSGETIPRNWSESPLDKTARCPWVWVGDRHTEIDLTRTFEKFLVVGNRITSDLVRQYICMTPQSKLMYIQAGTFKELEFPGDGITIEEYVDRPVQNSRPVHNAEETVCAPVVGGHSDSVE